MAGTERADVGDTLVILGTQRSKVDKEFVRQRVDKVLLNLSDFDSPILAFDDAFRSLDGSSTAPSFVVEAEVANALVQRGKELADQLVESGVPRKTVSLLRTMFFADIAAARWTNPQVVPVPTQGSAATSSAESGASNTLDPFEPLTVSKIAKVLGVSDETVRNREKANELFAVLNPARKRGRGYPAFQTWPHVVGAPLTKVLAVLKDLDGASAYQFFSSPSPELAGLTPVEALIGKLTVPRVMDNDGLGILKATNGQRLAAAVGAAKAFHADATA